MTTQTTIGREPVQIIEIDQAFCNLIYGTLPCTAVIGDTGPDRCFNGLGSCQDEPNYDEGTKTLRFCKPSDSIDPSFGCIPSVRSVRVSPTIINAGSGSKDRGALGVRGAVKITFQDHPHDDSLVDKYRTQRDYIATDRSTFWAKWLARNPFFSNLTIRVVDGYIGQSIPQMNSRTYLIEAVDGPDSNGTVTLTAKDILVRADDDKAQAPAPTFGELTAQLLDTNLTSFTLQNHGSGIYPTGGGKVRFGSEIIQYASAVDAGPTMTFSTLTRGVDGTEAATHDTEERAQLVKEYVNEPVVDIVYDLLTNFAGIDSSFIDKSSWDDEGDTYLSPYALSAVLSDPVGVTTLIGEISEQAQLYVWWNDRSQKVELKAVRPEVASAEWTDEGNILRDTTKLVMKPRDRITQTWIYWNIKDWTAGLDRTNFSKLQIEADLELEGAQRIDESRIRKVFARWIDDSAQASDLASRLLTRYSNMPRTMVVELDAKDRDVWTGDVVEITSKTVVDIFGQTVKTRWQVISADEIDSGHRVRYILQDFSFIAERAAHFMEDAAPVFTSATDEQKETGAFYSDTDGLMSDLSQGYRYQ